MTLSAEDRLNILDVLTMADNAASKRDAAAYVKLFTDDVALDGEQGVHAGKETLRNAVGPIWESEGPASLHLTLNPVFDIVDDNIDEVVAHSVLLIMSLGIPPKIITAASITQQLKRIGTSWLISHRTVKTSIS
jgi:hypothetical protein